MHTSNHFCDMIMITNTNEVFEYCLTNPNKQKYIKIKIAKNFKKTNHLFKNAIGRYNRMTDAGIEFKLKYEDI